MDNENWGGTTSRSSFLNFLFDKSRYYSTVDSIVGNQKVFLTQKQLQDLAKFIDRMWNLMKYDSFGDYIGAVIDHINQEYESTGVYGSLTQEEKDTIFTKLAHHYNIEDSINNTSSDIINYIRERKYFENQL